MIERGKFRSLTLVNWNGFFARTFDLDELVTTCCTSVTPLKRGPPAAHAIKACTVSCAPGCVTRCLM